VAVGVGDHEIDPVEAALSYPAVDDAVDSLANVSTSPRSCGFGGPPVSNTAAQLAPNSR